MLDAGVVLSLPTESIAIRFVIASVVAALLARLMLRVGLRVPGVRAATAVVPAAAIVIVTALFWGSLHVPWVMLPVEAIDALPIKLGDTYQHVAPIAAPLIAGLWLLVASIRVAYRWRTLRRTCRKLAGQFDLRTTRSGRVGDTVRRVAAQMRLPAPATAVVPKCAGGASVIGIRQPILVVDAELAGRLDDQELEGVVAHELAHIRRRDNLVAFVLGIVRDLAFFVPGGAWALRQLHAERELAADELAVATTRRPGALASGLLKVLDSTAADTPCSALVPRGTLVGRVEQLVDPEPITRLRSGLEMASVAVVLAIAVGAAAQVPAAISNDGEHYALAVYLQGMGDEAAGPAVEASSEPRAFDVYRRATKVDTVSSSGLAAETGADDDPDELRRSALYACAEGSCADDAPSPRLGIEPKPRVLLPGEALVDRWRAKPLVSMDDGIAVYWLEELE